VCAGKGVRDAASPGEPNSFPWEEKNRIILREFGPKKHDLLRGAQGPGVNLPKVEK